uniref:phosphoribosylformylglycinamidine synthase n=1 Tax=Synstelium polycarpum TaxID=361085 RepID=A0A1L2FUV4_9MYCE|nr:phosphoribosylformylglycinamide synthase [Synstelium polycarpum]
MTIKQFYRTPALSEAALGDLRKRLNAKYPEMAIESIASEYCFNVQYPDSHTLTDEEAAKLTWLLSETFEPHLYSDTSFLARNKATEAVLVEVGPRMNFTTTYSANATSICASCNLSVIDRIERSRRYLVVAKGSWSAETTTKFIDEVHDRMTECHYPSAITSFDTGVVPKPVTYIPVVEEGSAALERINKEMGLAFDEQDLALYTDLFMNHLKRNPSDVECFDIGQSNSEHSRYVLSCCTLFQIVKDTLKANPNNSLIAFCDNSSAIKGYPTKVLVPTTPTEASAYQVGERDQAFIFTAETHNFPSGVAPFPGAETGTGGRIRDTHSTGRGSIVVAGTVGYCVGNLNIPGYDLPWEDKTFEYPNNLAAPLKIEIEASNGASDYGNKFGEPVIVGFTRSYGERLPNGERREWIKPIMFSAGIGYMDGRHLKKEAPEVGMVVIKAGGPAYRIGMGGGSASSMVGGDNKTELDFSAVQRGDAEMGQKLNRIIRSCVESEMFVEGGNPIVSVHDQGAGGSGNVLKEIADPLGAKIYLDRFNIGDPTLSAMELWGAEYQEQDAILMRAEDKPRLQTIANRERLPISAVGDVTGDGFAVVIDKDGNTPVNLPLDKVLQKMPPKTFHMDHIPKQLIDFTLPADLTVDAALQRVLRLLAVGSKRFLTTKVDRAVTGLVARQQCVGPLHTPLSDVAVIASGYFGITGAATSIGEQPIKGFVCAKSMAYLTVGEALTNLMFAAISSIEDIKCSGNWMWAAKLKGEGVELYDACVAMHDTMIDLGIAIDGGKDSLSMAAKAPVSGSADELVKGPGALVVSTYVPCVDITKTVTPDLKLTSAEDSAIVYIDFGRNNNFIAGSALAQCFRQVGNDTPKIDVALLKAGFLAVQELVHARLITAGHDRSDGGIITTLIEMTLGGNRGMNIVFPAALCDATNSMAVHRLLFSEELGAAVECRRADLPKVLEILAKAGVPAYDIGHTTIGAGFTVQIGTTTVLDSTVAQLSHAWEETSYRLEQLQANPAFVENEMLNLKARAIGGGKGPQYKLSFKPSPTIDQALIANSPTPRVAILREEGSNGDREMAAAFHFAGFEAWDVTMSDLVAGTVVLDERFQGVAFVGGFSYGDVLDSSKGWAGSIKFNSNVAAQFDQFYNRTDTFSIGLCNGCQLMALLGWVPWRGIEAAKQPRFIHNASGRFESRFVNVAIGKTNAVMLQGMEGTVLGCWSQHGEGRAYFPEESMLADVEANNLSPIRYVNDDGETTESYPYNPSGTPNGIASLVSRDGRHLAIMPHPERSFLSWQWPWMPENIKQEVGGLCQPSPWLRIFQNARIFCAKNQKQE